MKLAMKYYNLIKVIVQTIDKDKMMETYRSVHEYFGLIFKRLFSSINLGQHLHTIIN